VDPTRKTALIAGVLFLITYITAIPAAFLLYPQCSTTPTRSSVPPPTRAWPWARCWRFSSSSPTSALPSCYSRSLKRQNEALALGYVSARLVECTFIAIGIVSLLNGRVVIAARPRSTRT
jgi:hypothetical protein